MRRLAAIVDGILKSEKRSDLSIERLPELHLVIDFKAAKAQGVAIPEAHARTFG